MLVLDSSVILASAFNEPGQMNLGEIIETAVISAINFAEIVAKLQALAEKTRAELGDSLTARKGTGVRPPGRVIEPASKPAPV